MDASLHDATGGSDVVDFTPSVATPAESPVHMAAPPLSWVTMAYERSQAIRVASGEQLRAVLQGRDPKWGATRADGTTIDVAPPALVKALLKDIRAGRTEGPVPVLGRTYARFAAEEVYLHGVLAKLVEAHVAWPWMARVRGISFGIAGRLLGKLSIERARTPSAFWAYCGLATILSPDGTEHGRVAARRARPGTPGAYNPAAKQTCYLLGLSLMRRGGHYKQYFQSQRALLAVTREHWMAGRQFRTALRKTEKLFLGHLWLVWRQAAGLPVVAPYVHARHPEAAYVGPWEMVDR